MADSTTATYTFTLPEVGASEDTWGTKLNANWTALDGLLDGTTAIAPNLIGWSVGGTLVTASAAELNYSVGVTSAIQTQLNAKQASDAGLTSIAGLTTAADRMIYTTAPDAYAVTTLTSAGRALLDDADATAQRTTLGLGNTATTDLIDEDDMASDTAAQAPTQRSVKAYVDGTSNGVGQTWQNPSRTTGTTYQNTTGKPIQVVVELTTSTSSVLQVSNDGVTFITLGAGDGDATQTITATIPVGGYYRAVNGTVRWAELR